MSRVEQLWRFLRRQGLALGLATWASCAVQAQPFPSKHTKILPSAGAK